MHSRTFSVVCKLSQIPLAGSGGALTLFQFFGYPHLTKRWSCTHLVSWSAGAYGVVILTTPLIAYLLPVPSGAVDVLAEGPSLAADVDVGLEEAANASAVQPGWSSAADGTVPPSAPARNLLPALVLPVLMVHNALGKCLASCCFTSIFLVINNSCTADQRGRVNGLAMSLSSGFKAIGPTLGAVLFAASIASDGLLLGVYTAFVVVAVTMGITTAASVHYLSSVYDAPPAAAAAAAV